MKFTDTEKGKTHIEFLEIEDKEMKIITSIERFNLDTYTVLNLDEITKLRDFLSQEISKHEQKQIKDAPLSLKWYVDRIKQISLSKGQELSNGEASDLVFHIERLQAESESLSFKLQGLDGVSELFDLIPNAVNKSGIIDVNVVRGFIKKHIASERESGKWYAVRKTKDHELVPAFYHRHYDTNEKWQYQGERYKESDFYYASPTPLNLEG